LAPDPAAIAANLARIRAEIGPGPEILAATKYVDVDGMQSLADAGVTLVGENRSDALATKQAALADRFTWDFIGHLQSRKVRDVVGRVRLIHAVDSLSVCGQIDARAAAPVDCLLQINVAQEESKAGIPPAQIDQFLDDATEFGLVRFRGLMTMPPLADDPEQARPWFSALRELRDELAPRWAGRYELTQLSMGTSQDYAAAAQEGATIVRLGSVLFKQ
jgi:pyridoxal phosphate enzyme (YggS family)